MTLEPGHFHAALVQKKMLLGIHPQVHVYSALNQDLLQHLSYIIGFNSRPTFPTDWRMDVRAGAKAEERCFREQPGNTVVIAGRNKLKIDRILGAVSNGLHVLADKPWVIEPEDFPKLERVFWEADIREINAWDMMTERFEITNILQRELMCDAAIFGTALPGSVLQPSLKLESVHYLKKLVAGTPLRRPEWWFDVSQAGEAIADVGTHLVDLAMWLLFPELVIDHKRHVEMVDAATWTTVLTPQQYHSLTAVPVPDDVYYHGNGSVAFRLRGVHVKCTTRWEYEAPPDTGDTHESIACGTLSQVVIRPVRGTHELCVIPNDPAQYGTVLANVMTRCDSWQGRWPGVRVHDRGSTIHIEIPPELHLGHEHHFASVLSEFMTYFHSPRQIPIWERANLLSKYHITTQAVLLAKQNHEFTPVG